MRRPTDIDPRAAAIDRLVRAGRAAMPDPSSIVDQHLGSVSVAIASERARSGRAPARSAGRLPRRRLVLIGAMAAFVAVPTLAMAGALPDPVQRVASTVAGAVGIDVPTPASEHANSPSRDGSGVTGDAQRSDADVEHAEDPTTSTTPDATKTQGATGTDDDRGHVNGTQPGKPEEGEQRGNRFGQVPGGPDQGKAGQPPGSGTKPVKPVQPATGKPPKDPKPATPAPATPAPATPTPPAPEPVTPAPATPDPTAPAPGGGGNGNGNAGGNGNGNGR